MKLQNALGKLKTKYLAFALVFILVYSFLLVHIVQAVTAAAPEPGTDANPLVSQDYVDSKINNLKAANDTLSKQLQAQAASTKFQVIQVSAGKQLIAGDSAEMIIRSGSAKTVASSAGGLSDLISGKDLLMGSTVPLNHLILVPRDDGRGFKAATTVWVMIKGTYTIK